MQYSFQEDYDSVIRGDLRLKKALGIPHTIY